MKNTTLLFIITIVFLCIGAYGQKNEKTIATSGNKPHWSNWSRGKDFKHLTRRSKNLGLEKGDKYLFVSEARLRSYWSEGNREFGYTPQEVLEEASDDAMVSIAQTLSTHVQLAIDNSTTRTGLEKQQLKERNATITSKASFSGFLKVGSYWETVIDQEDGYKWTHGWILYSYEKSKFDEMLEKYADALGAPDLVSDIKSRIQSAADNVNDIPDDEFSF